MDHGVGALISRCNMKFPYSICSELYDPVKYYSYLLEDFPEFKEYDQYLPNFEVRYDDPFIIEAFGGCLNKDLDINKITLSFQDNQLKSIDIVTKTFKHCFNGSPYLHSFKYTSKDIDEFFKLRRREKNSMVKIRVATCTYLGQQCQIYSALWQIVLFWNYKDEGYYYIGPKSEKKQMMGKLRKYYGSKAQIKLVELLHRDYNNVS